MRPALHQPVRIHGLPCVLASHGQTYIVRTAAGRVIGRAMTRLLAVARAAVTVHQEGGAA